VERGDLVVFDVGVDDACAVNWPSSLRTWRIEMPAPALRAGRKCVTVSIIASRPAGAGCRRCFGAAELAAHVGDHEGHVEDVELVGKDGRFLNWSGNTMMVSKATADGIDMRG
jgi:hypothetical protein